MKEMVEEYGMVALGITIIILLINILPKLKTMYFVGGEVFLKSIGG